MHKRLTKTGNSVALALERPLLEATGLEPGATAGVSTDGDVIVITPRRDADRSEKLREGIEEMNRRYGGVFRRLAE